MEKEKIKRVIILMVNYLRVIVGLLLLCLFLGELYSVNSEPDIYEKVYTGEFLGDQRYESLASLKFEIIYIIIFATVYLLITFLCFTKIKNTKRFPYILTLADICMIFFIGYSLYKTFILMNY